MTKPKPFARSLLFAALATALSSTACSDPPPAGDAEHQPHVDESQGATKAAPVTVDAELQKKADALAHRVIVLDGHVDLPHRLVDALDEKGVPKEDVTERTEGGDFDVVRAREGGLDAPFMSIYTPAALENNGAKAHADQLIDLVDGLIARAPETFAKAITPDDVRKNFAAQKISLPMGMENGAPLEGKLENLRHFYDRGIRYITLAHSEDNHLSDSSYDDRHSHKGLTDFGKTVVNEMNKLGILVDISHLSDAAADQVLDLSAVPVIASHSSCRHFTPGWERNMSDKMIKKLAEKGGVIQINFGSTFVDDRIRKVREKRWKAMKKARKKAGVPDEGPAAKAFRKTYYEAHPVPSYSTLSVVADHVMHVVKLVGVDHVGFGSDFDGVGDSLPVGLKDVSDYPALIAELMRRGLDEKEIEKIASGNVLRVWQAAEDHAQAARAGQKTP